MNYLTWVYCLDDCLITQRKILFDSSTIPDDQGKRAYNWHPEKRFGFHITWRGSNRLFNLLIVDLLYYESIRMGKTLVTIVGYAFYIICCLVKCFICFHIHSSHQCNVF